jgi:hypothetical protein
LRGFTYITVNNWGGHEIEDQPAITAISPQGKRGSWVQVIENQEHQVLSASFLILDSIPGFLEIVNNSWTRPKRAWIEYKHPNSHSGVTKI